MTSILQNTHPSVPISLCSIFIKFIILSIHQWSGVGNSVALAPLPLRLPLRTFKATLSLTLITDSDLIQVRGMESCVKVHYYGIVFSPRSFL